MKYLIFLVLILYSSTVFSLGFGSSGKTLKIRTGENEFTFIDIKNMSIVYDSKRNEAHIGDYHRTDRDHTGHFEVVLLPIKTFTFDTEKQFQKWIKSVKKSYKCLTIEGIVKC